jgi:hypothetical protein
LPGSESRIDCAFFFGSSAGTEDDAERWLVRAVVRAGRERTGIAGRRRVAPTLVSDWRRLQLALGIYYVVNYIPKALLAKRDAIVY